MTGTEPPETPEVGAVRFTQDGQVEFYNGAVWGPYTELPDPGDGPLFRGGDGSGGPNGTP